MTSSKILTFIQKELKQKAKDIVPTSGSGSNREYFRIFLEDDTTFILTKNAYIAENESFIYFTQKFLEHNINVPKLIAVNDSKIMYLQEDLGDDSLLNRLIDNGYTTDIFDLYKQSLTALAHLQINLCDKIDYTHCYDFKTFDNNVVYNDLFYFKNFFLDRLDIAYQKDKLINDFEAIAQKVNQLNNQYFLFRDFQARNIMLKENQPYFIDYQGGMAGFIGYDLVSILYQAKAQLPQQWKEDLKNIYFKVFTDRGNIELETLQENYKLGLILRFFQVFGTYGFRGLVERKSHFLDSIMLNIKNIEFILKNNLLREYPYLQNIAEQITTEETKQKINQIISA